MQKHLRMLSSAVTLALGVAVLPVFAQAPPASQTDTTATKSKRSRKKSSGASAAAQPSAPASTPGAATPPATTSQTPPQSANKQAKISTPIANNVSAADIAAAESAGKVWVNTESGVYHKGGKYYGKTKQGKFMTEADAQKAGYHEDKSEAGAKKKS
jgi:hypothetical protein